MKLCQQHKLRLRKLSVFNASLVRSTYNVQVLFTTGAADFSDLLID